MLVALAMSSGWALAQAQPIPVTPVTPADPWSSVLSAVASSPWAAVALYGIRTVDQWRQSVERIARDVLGDATRCLDQWRDDMREHRLGITVTHRTDDP
jgi:hypothetical protein